MVLLRTLFGRDRQSFLMMTVRRSKRPRRAKTKKSIGTSLRKDGAPMQKTGHVFDGEGVGYKNNPPSDIAMTFCAARQNFMGYLALFVCQKLENSIKGPKAKARGQYS